MVGRTISHYEILEKLGEGGMGVVYRARDTRLGRMVAVKILPAEALAKPDRKLRFIQEARTASALNHPNIVTVYDIDACDGMDFIAMEYVPGKPSMVGRAPLAFVKENCSDRFGRMVIEFLGMAPQVEEPPVRPQLVDWSPLFAAARLDLSRLHETAPGWDTESRFDDAGCR